MLARYVWGGRSVVTSTRRQALAVCGAFAAGGAFAIAAAPMVGGPGAVAAVALGLTAPIGVAKSSTACGYNVALSLASASLPGSQRVPQAIAYAVVVTTVAAMFGLSLGLVGRAVGAGAWIALAVPLLAMLGLIELGVIPLRRAITLPWQVPVEWVSRRRSAPAVWGLLLGTGLTTYMPHPVHFGLLFMALVLPIPAGPLLLMSYGIGRAVPTVLVALSGSDEMLDQLGNSMWRLRIAGHVVGGLASVATASAVASVLLLGWYLP